MKRSNLARSLLILDLDETLIHALPKENAFPPWDFEATGYVVRKSPGVDTFLDEIRNVFEEIAVWSTGGSDYVAAVVTQLFPTGYKLAFQWSLDKCTRRHDLECRYGSSFYHIKKLAKVRPLGWDLSRVLIVDDSPEKLSLNYGNHVLIPAFLGDSDDAYLAALTCYLKSIADESNYQKIEKRGWHLHL